MEANAPVFIGAALFIALFVLVGVLFPEFLGDQFEAIKQGISKYAGWFYILVANGVVLFAFFLLLTKYGTIRLGGENAKPEFGLWSWVAMLFSAGIGMGLVFWSVAEPITHFVYPPDTEPQSAEAAVQALRITYFHWGFHVWALFGLVALCLAYFCYNCGLPLTIRSAFYPLIGDRIYRTSGHVIETVAVVATLFGVATTLGFGVKQIGAGLEHVFGLESTPVVSVLTIALITGMATTSVVLGLKRGIRRVSVWNMYIAATLMILTFILGPSLFILNAVVEGTGSYLQFLPTLSSRTEAFSAATREAARSQQGWTAFYWGWVISWSPFVGMFIAQISKGRTIREFLFGVLFAPTIITFVWLAVFGGSALHLELHGDAGIVSAVQKEEVEKAFFLLLENFQFAEVTSIMVIVVVTLFFVTSSDSGSLVIDIITAGGDRNPPRAQRIFWAVTEGTVAAVLLIGGGLRGLQSAAVSAGLPFAAIIAAMAFGLYRALNHREKYEIKREGLEEDTTPP